MLKFTKTRQAHTAYNTSATVAEHSRSMAIEHSRNMAKERLIKKLLFFLLLAALGSLSAQNVNDVTFTGDYFNTHLLGKYLPQIENTRATDLREGKFNNIVIFITFPGVDFDLTLDDVDALFNGEAEGSSLYSYYRDISGGKFEIISSFFPISNTNAINPYRSIYPRSRYMGSAVDPETAASLLSDAEAYVQAEIAQSFLNGELEGNVDFICYVVQGKEEYWNYFLWSSGGGGKTFIMEKQFDRAVLVHETYHAIGAPDLYVHPPGTTYNIAPVGSWDPMESATSHPQSSLTYITDNCGKFIPDSQIQEITQTGTYTLYDSWDRDPTHTIAYKIASPTSQDGEFFMLEYRRKHASGGRIYESNNNEGIIISRINPKSFTTYGGNAKSDGTRKKPFGVYVYRENGTYTYNGNLANACFSSTGFTSFKSFSEDSTPSAFLSNGYSDWPGLGEIEIDQFSVAGGDLMTFRVTFPVIESKVWEIGEPNREDVIACLSNGKLLITGNGAMMDWDLSDDNKPPWYAEDVQNQINEVEFIFMEQDGIGVTNIGNMAFFNCVNLITINIPNSITSIGSGSFYNCISLPSIAIPENVTKIGSEAFFKCTSLAEVIIPVSNSITSIGTLAFYECANLKSFTIPSGITIVDEYLFAFSGLTSIDIPCGIENIKINAFEGCTDLAKVWICESVTDIGTDEISAVFMGCIGLTDIWVYWENPPDILSNTFGNVEIATVNLHIPCQYYDNYIDEDAKVWNEFNIVGESQTITVSAVPSGYGTVTGGGTYPCGKEITITATPNIGREFLYWMEGGVEVPNAGASYTFIVTKTREFVAHFETEAYTIILNDNPSGAAITLEGAGIYDYETELEVKATFNNECYTFDGWFEDGVKVSETPDYFFFVLKSRTLTATFVPKKHEIVLLPNPLPGGTTGDEGFYDCGGSITVTATANDGYEFVSWTESGVVVPDAGASYTFTVAVPRILTANFALKTYDIALYSNPSEGGTTSGGGTYTHGDEAILSAIPNDYYEFVKWTDINENHVSFNNPYVVDPVTGPHTLIAVFKWKTCTITVEADPPELGMAIGGGNDLDCGTSVAVAAAPNNQYPCIEFTHWTKDGITVSTKATDTFEITEDYCSCTLKAHFALKTYQITVTTGDNGVILSDEEVADGIVGVECGDDKTFTFIPDWCYQIAEVLIDGVPNQTAKEEGEYTFETITDDHTIEVTFVKILYQITVTTGDNGVILSDGEPAGSIVGVDCGDDTTFTFTPDWCYQIAEVLIDGVPNPSAVAAGEYTFETITDDHTIEVTFVKIPCTVTLLTDPLASGTVFLDADNYSCGDTVTITATSNACYTFIEWRRQDGTFVSEDNPYSFVVTKDTVFVAHFGNFVEINVYAANPPENSTATGGGSYSCPDNVIATAYPNDDCYTFLNWTDENDVVVSSNNPYVFTVTGTRTLIANFEVKQHYIFAIPSPSAGGTTEVIGGNIQDCGEMVTVEAIPASCYHFVNWTTIDGTEQSTQPLYEFPVTGNLILFANFAKNICEITLLANTPAGGNPEGSGTYICGTPVVARANTDPCYTFINWTKNGNEVSTDENYHFTVEETCTLIANFERNHHTITVVPVPPPGGIAEVLGDATDIKCGDERTVFAIANVGYIFVGWYENGNPVPGNPPWYWTFVVTRDHILEAHFALETYEIIVEIDPEGCGTVDGGGSYTLGENVTVTASPDSDDCCSFLGWKENGAYVWLPPVYPFEVTGSRTLTAIFERKIFNIILSVGPDGGGSVSDDTNIPCGDSITITAKSEHCWKFVNWTENGIEVSKDNPWTFEVLKTQNLVANFERDIYNIVVYAEPIAGGEVSGGGNNIACDSLITVTAIPDDCYTFAGWWTTDSIFVYKDESYTFEVTKSDTLVARFEIKSFTINLTAEPTMGGTVSGGGTYDCGTKITVTATPDDCYDFVNWTEDGEELSDTLSYTFNVTATRNLIANFKIKLFNVTVEADPTVGGDVSGGDTGIKCDTVITVKASPNTGYNFVKWTTKAGVSLSNNANFDVTVNKDSILVAHFIPKIFDIIIVNPDDCVTISGNSSGSYSYGDTLTVVATVVEDCCGVATINGKVVQTGYVYNHIVTESDTLIVNFEIPKYSVTAIANDTTYGSTKVTGSYDACTTAQVEALKDDCYRFVNWTTINGEFVSKENPYSFEVTKDITLIANFSALDFDTYCPILWNNTFMLDLKKLREEGFDIIGCKWYKNGIEEVNTRTINEFSYSAGPKATDLLEPEPTYYMFRIITRNRGELCSTLKSISYDGMTPAPDDKLWAYPNPVTSGMPFSVEGTAKGDEVQVYNQSGICVHSTIAGGETIILTLHVEAGVYVVWANGKQVKVIIIR